LLSGDSYAKGTFVAGGFVAISMTTCIALLRGINVGQAKRIAMADLRRLVEKLGCTNVRTLLNSGNVVFEINRPNTNKLALTIESAIQSTCGFLATVVVVTAADLNAIIRADPLLRVARDSSKHLVAFVARDSVLEKANPLLAVSWKPEEIAIGAKAVYLWCPKGIIASRLLQELMRLAGDAVTTRNWATVIKLQNIVHGDM
jgi:uncharacterized protein (DUF1697 family)